MCIIVSFLQFLPVRAGFHFQVPYYMLQFIMFTRSLEIIWLRAGDGYRRSARRRCTDPFCAMVFVVFLFGMWCLAQSRLCGLRMPSGSLWDSVAMDENRNCQKSKKHPVRHTCKPDFNLWAAEILGSDAPGLSWPPKASLRSWGQSSTMPWEKGTWQSCPMAPVFSASSCLAQGFMPWLGSRNCVSNAFFF